MNNLMSLLPNDLIMKIIREADGGMNTHKRKMKDIHDIILFSNDFSCNHIRAYRKTIERRFLRYAQRIKVLIAINTLIYDCQSGLIIYG